MTGRWIAATALLLAASAAHAQPPGGMPDLHAMAGKPLPVPDLPEGTVTVRVARQLPMNGVAGVEVSAIVVATSGEARKRTVKTGDDGRATFEGLPTGGTFEAEVTVDGEHLQSTKFPIPAEGGTRVMLIAGLGAAPAGGGEERFTLGAVTGRVAPADDLPAGTLELRLAGEDGRPIAGKLVQLGQVGVGGENALKVLRAVSDGSGTARFTDLATGDKIGYAAVIEHQGLRLGSEAFRMPADKGARGDIQALARTSDTSVLRIDERSRVILEVGEDSLQVMEKLVFKNTSDKIFDPGPDGLLVPLPAGEEGAREIEGGMPFDVRAGEGVLVHAPIPPSRAAVFAQEIHVGFVIPAAGSSRAELRQKLPFGLESPLVLVPSGAHLTVTGPGLRSLAEQKDSQGNAVSLYALDEIAPGGMLPLTVDGLPALDHTGRDVAAGLCLVLIAAAVVAARRPAGSGRTQAEVDKLAERREKLFAELVALERNRREAAAAGKTNGVLDERRQELVSKLENVYRDLARRDEGDGASP